MPKQNTKLGLRLFMVYLVFYLGFMLLTAFSASTMESTPVAGVNLAILYGFALILGAFFLALVYGLLCGRTDDKLREEGDV
ncbi:MAG: DUF485 domain-containing protein [Planctomycetaceae bacterium]